MASIFKRTRDRSKRNATWWIEYTNEHGERRRKKGFTDRRLTEQLAAHLEDEARRKKSGLVDRAKEELRDHRLAPIESHLTEYETHLSYGSRTKKHKTLTMSRVRKVVVEAGIETLDDLQVGRVDAYVHSLREAGLGARTLNHYIQTLISFCNFLVASGRLKDNPLKGVTRYKAKTDVRHKRRALTFEEVRSLIQSARNSNETIQSYEPEVRAKLYEIAFLTGFRRNELASLTPGHFQLGGPRPAVRLEAPDSKHREEDKLPLHPSLQKVLPEWLKGLNATARLFPRLAQKKTWLMVRKDLERVGIPYETNDGIADFHSLRHSFVTELDRSKASATATRLLARHSDMKMTGVYTHSQFDDLAAALARLSDVSSTPESGQYIGRTACHSTGDDTSRRDARWQKNHDGETSESPEDSSSFDASWHNRDRGPCRHGTPPTPPGIRVRTSAVRLVKLWFQVSRSKGNPNSIRYARVSDMFKPGLRLLCQ